MLIVGILASMAFVNYRNIKENALDREAQANLRLVVAAERIYRIENGVYWPAANATDINTNLRLHLSDAGNRNWDFRATVGGASPTCADAIRFNGPNARTWRLRSSDIAPVSNSACP